MYYGSPQRQHQQQQSNNLNQPYFRKDDQQQMSSGLLRYRSAPSSLFGEVNDYFLPVRPSSPETETMFSRIFSQDMEKAFGAATAAGALRSSQFEEASTAEFPDSPSQIVYQQQQQQMLKNSSVEGSQNRTVGSMGMDAEQVKNNSSSLIRQSSSPAGLFTHLSVENGFDMMRGLGGLRNATRPSGDSANRIQRQLSFSSRQNSIMSQISEIGSEGMDDDNPEDSSDAHQSFIPGFLIGSSDEASMLSENNLSGMKRGSDGKVKIISNLNSLESQNGNARNHVSVLSPQVSLPKTSSEMAAIEKFLQLQDAVPCKIRAKRGYATHPRSIAERVRRTKISERMRKLQELVPNMDKQTNTADMLDLAVDYIKDLQKQAKTLSDAQASCTCSASK